MQLKTFWMPQKDGERINEMVQKVLYKCDGTNVDTGFH